MPTSQEQQGTQKIYKNAASTTSRTQDSMDPQGTNSNLEANSKDSTQEHTCLSQRTERSHRMKDTGTATIRAEWEKSGKITRAEEMEEARRILHLPEVDGDRVLLLIHEVTMVTGSDRRQVKASLFNDKGSTCSMVTKKLVRTLGLESIKKTVVVQSFGHTDSIDTEFVVLELLKQDGTIDLISA